MTRKSKLRPVHVLRELIAEAESRKGKTAKEEVRVLKRILRRKEKPLCKHCGGLGGSEYRDHYYEGWDECIACKGTGLAPRRGK